MNHEKTRKQKAITEDTENTDVGFEGLVGLFEQTQAAHSVAIALVVRDWLFGWYIMEFKQSDLKGMFEINLRKFWEFYQGYAKIQQTLSVKFSLSWSYYVVLLTISSEDERLVELILPKDANIHASAYQLYLPDKETLKKATHEKSSEVQDKGGNHE